MFKCVSLSSSWSKNESQQNRTEQNGKTHRHRGNKFNVQVCFYIIILISTMNLNRTEWNRTEKLIDIRGINSMFNCVSLSSSWSPKWISTERNGMEKLIDVYVRISRVFCVYVSELLNPLQYPSIKFGSGTVLEQKNWILIGLGTKKSIFWFVFILMIVNEKNESIASRLLCFFLVLSIHRCPF